MIWQMELVFLYLIYETLHEAVAKKPTSDEKIKSQVFKTDEQMKGSKIANKRRLFNRKTGE